MQVCLCRVTLLAEQCHSLKEKRSVVRAIKDRVFARHKVLVSEVGGQNSWQRVVVGFAVVGNDTAVVSKTADAVLDMIEGLGQGRVVNVQRAVEPFGEDAPDSAMDVWIPEFAKDSNS